LHRRAAKAIFEKKSRTPAIGTESNQIRGPANEVSTIFFLIWIPWMAVVVWLFAAHHLSWWTYLIIAVSLGFAYPVGSVRATAEAIGRERARGGSRYTYLALAWLVIAAAILYATHHAWWIYLVLGSAVWIGGSMGYVAQMEQVQHLRRNAL
jgi:hypothetical protein